MNEIKERKYRYPDGRILQVCPGIGEPPCYFTGHVKPSGSRKRYVAKVLPVRESAAQAQADLDQVAAKRGWPEVE